MIISIGQSWSISLPEEVDRFTQKYIDILLDNGLVKQIFDLLRKIDVQEELSRLEKGGGVGDQRHRALLSYFISDQRQILSDCLFTLSCQEPLSKNSCLDLIRYFRDTPQSRGDGTLDGVNLSVLFSFLTSIDVGHLVENDSGETTWLLYVILYYIQWCSPNSNITLLASYFLSPSEHLMLILFL